MIRLRHDVRDVDQFDSFFRHEIDSDLTVFQLLLRHFRVLVPSCSAWRVMIPCEWMALAYADIHMTPLTVAFHICC